MSQVLWKIENLQDLGFRVRVFRPGDPTTLELQLEAPRNRRVLNGAEIPFTDRFGWSLRWEVYQWDGSRRDPGRDFEHVALASRKSRCRVLVDAIPESIRSDEIEWLDSKRLAEVVRTQLDMLGRLGGWGC